MTWVAGAILVIRLMSRSIVKNLDGVWTKRNRNLVTLFMIILAEILTGIYALSWIHQSPNYVTSQTYSSLLWWTIPLAAILWLIIRRSFRFPVSLAISLIIGVGCFILWVINMPNFRAVGDLLQATSGILTVIVWGAFLITLMALINSFIAAKITVGAAIVLVLLETTLFGLAPLLSGNYGSKPIVFISAAMIVLIAALIWTAVIELLLLLYREAGEIQFFGNKMKNE